MNNRENVKVLRGYQVVAVDGMGVYIADESGNCWHVGGPAPGKGEDNKLAREYRNAFE